MNPPTNDPEAGSASGLGDTDGMVASAEDLYQQVTESALAATSARVVAAIDFDPVSGERRLVGFSGLGEPLRRALEAVRVVLPGFDLRRLRIGGRSNAVVDAVYRAGVPRLLTYREAAGGSILPVLIEIAERFLGTHYSYVCPLVVAGRSSGSLTFQFAEPPAERERRVGEAFAAQAALLLHTQRLLAEERRRARHAEQVAAVLEAVGAAPDVAGALEALVRGVVSLFGATRGQARLYPERGALQVKVAPDGTVIVRELAGEAKAGSFSASLRAGGPPVLVEDYWALDPVVYPLHEEMRRAGLRSAINVPIASGRERIGSLHVDHTVPGYFSWTDLGLVEALGAQAGAVVARMAAQEVAHAARGERAKMEGALLVARTVAHDLNNALAPITGGADLLRLDPAVAAHPARSAYLKMIEAAAADAAEKVRRLQSIVRIEEQPSGLGPDKPILDLDRSTRAEGGAAQAYPRLS